MALTSTTADAVATAFCAAQSPAITDATAKAAWKSLVELIYSHLLTDLVVTLAPGTVVTVGSAATQTGPAAPVILTVS